MGRAVRKGRESERFVYGADNRPESGTVTLDGWLPAVPGGGAEHRQDIRRRCRDLGARTRTTDGKSQAPQPERFPWQSWPSEGCASSPGEGDLGFTRCPIKRPRRSQPKLVILWLAGSAEEERLEDLAFGLRRHRKITRSKECLAKASGSSLARPKGPPPAGQEARSRARCPPRGPGPTQPVGLAPSHQDVDERRDEGNINIPWPPEPGAARADDF